MTEPQQEDVTRLPASTRWARLLGLPDPQFTPEQRAAYQQWMDDGDRQLREVIARRQQAAS
ncbi:hypothetical protein AB0C07_38800 [Actinoplanes missouriensis]|uniref:hypothetical protein n=1 Tax=Actinoplanes missouriensis TaxID=1866 RepID=UPI0034056DF4